jgi:Rrf2 family transcriptional regulator, iron-sulfur cluster assembly transcription factor
MTVIFSKKCELALQAVLFLSTKKPEELTNTGTISDLLNVPKEFVSKVLQSLTGRGIIHSRKGKSGGFSLGKKPSEIKLIDIVIAIDGDELFKKCVLGFPGCSQGEPCPIHSTWGKLRDDAYQMLNNHNLEELRDQTYNKIYKK